MAVLDTLRQGKIDHWWSPIWTIARNPIVIGAVAGIVVSGTGFTVPPVLFDPLSMMGDMAVPGALLAFGLSFKDGWKLPLKGTRSQLTIITGTKLIIQPVLAWVIGGPILGWTGNDLLAIVVTSALPTAQNVYIYAMRYRQSETLMRDSVFITTMLSVPAILLCSVLLG
nr:AEC family transporter [Brevibacterium yomogidense]